jgi:hypothetical protein
MKRKNPRMAYLPIVVIPAVAPSVMLPLLHSSHMPDYAQGLAMGLPIGLALIGLVWMLRGSRTAC